MREPKSTSYAALALVASFSVAFWLGSGTGVLIGLLAAAPGFGCLFYLAATAGQDYAEALAEKHAARVRPTPAYRDACEKWRRAARPQLFHLRASGSEFPIELCMTLRGCRIIECDPATGARGMLEATDTEIKQLRRSFLKVFIPQCGPVSTLALMVCQTRITLAPISSHETLEALARARPSS